MTDWELDDICAYFLSKSLQAGVKWAIFPTTDRSSAHFEILIGRVPVDTYYALGGRGGRYQLDVTKSGVSPSSYALYNGYYNYKTQPREPACGEDGWELQLNDKTKIQMPCYKPWVKSMYPPRSGIDPWVHSDCLVHAKMEVALCSTCCCQGGYAKGGLSVTLVKQTPGEGCMSWHGLIDMITRMYLNGIRTMKVAKAMGTMGRCFD